MTWVVNGNEEGFAEQGAGILDPDVCRDPPQRSHRELARHGARLDERRLGGFVRQCHGDPKDALGVLTARAPRPAGYTHDTTTRVYRTLVERASASLKSGQKR
jgi:hypothetical protein